MNELRIHHLAFSDDALQVVFDDEQSVTIPLRYFPRLQAGTSIDCQQWQLIGGGLGVHWESLDEDLSVENILTAYSRSKGGEYAPASRS